MQVPHRSHLELDLRQSALKLVDKSAGPSWLSSRCPCVSLELDLWQSSLKFLVDK